MEKDVESHSPDDSRTALELRLLGPMTVSRDGVVLALPASRKVRALIAYLAVAPQSVSRSQLCELLWDVPDDPRGELRWSLSKARGVVDQPDVKRIDASGDAVKFDAANCFVDAVAIRTAAQDGVETLSLERLRELAALFGGDFLEGLEIDRNPVFNNWLVAQRRRLRGCHIAVLEHLVRRAPDDEAFHHLETWLDLAPFDKHVHEMLLQALARRGQFREGDEHLAAAIRLFEADGLDCTSLREVWRAARAQTNTSARVLAADVSPATADASGPALSGGTPRRASIAVMPFAGSGIAPGDAADGLAHDIITRLAKLRTLFVIAQGTVFALQEKGIGPEAAGRMLNVDYIVSGSQRRQGDRLTVTVELSETRTARIVWAEVFNQKLDSALLLLDEIGNRIVSSIASEIETIERNRAILRPPNSLDAWDSHHRGLWHMYRFNKADNDRAQQFFETAVRLDPTFSRAYAALSFTHWQNAFQGWANRQQEIDRAYDFAGQSLMVDDRDPAAHWAMGRALWLRGSHDQSLTELDQAIDLSPNFAQAHYTLAFVHAQTGDPLAAISSSDYSRHLSPFDPLLFGMFGARTIALVRLGRFDEAAEWALKAAARPNAHAHILALAAFSLALADRNDEARAFIVSIRKALPNYGLNDFFTAFHFPPDSAIVFREGAKRIGMS